MEATYVPDVIVGVGAQPTMHKLSMHHCNSPCV